MTDEPKFSPFAPTEAPRFAGEPEQTPAKKPRGKKKSPKKIGVAPNPKKVKAALDKITVTGGGAGATARIKTRKPRPVLIPIGILPALGGLAEAETSMLMSIIGNLQDAPKKSRSKIVAALAKVFA